MATKRKTREKETEEDLVEKKRVSTEDRLSNLPKDLQVRILSFLDTKQAVQTSTLSKSWVPLWTWIPVLEFNGFSTHNLYDFDKFINKVLFLRDPSAKLDRLIFKRRGTSSAKLLNTIFKYAFSHGVKHFEAHIFHSRNDTWPLCLNASFESLTSLKLQSELTISCSFLGRRSESFKNLTVLYLEGARISDRQPFSGFPVLEKLTLLNCDICKKGEALNIHARNLSDLTISGYNSFKCCELTTPRLKFFMYRGCEFPLIKTDEVGLPVLDTIAIDFNGAYSHMHEKRTFDDLLSLFDALSNATSLTLFSSTVEILSTFGEELVKRNRVTFPKLKCLKLDYRYFKYQNLFDRPLRWPFEKSAEVKAYLFQNSPDGKVATLYRSGVVG